MKPGITLADIRLHVGRVRTLADMRAVREKYPVDSAGVRALLARIPPSWTMWERSEDGACFKRGNIQVIVSLERYDDGSLWVHASACGRTGPQRFYLPSWEEMKRVKHDFFGPDTETYQVFPPDCEWVNDHPCVLHLFGRLDGARVLPDFTRGLGAL